MDKHDASLLKVESHVPCKYYGGDTRDPPGSSARVQEIVSSSYNNQWSRVVGGSLWLSPEAFAFLLW